MDLSDNFDHAATDYLCLLEKNYPQKAIIKLIGDRYSLSGVERTMLYRGLTTRENVKYRTKTLIKEEQLKGQKIHIDGYNVLITIGSYLNGSIVFLSNDNLLRDASEVHGKIFRTELINRSIDLILSFLEKKQVKAIYFYFDSPVSKSGKLASKINQLLREKNISGMAQTANSPDYVLKNLGDGIIATSDSTIIDKANIKIFDLPRYTICYFFEPNFIDLYQSYSKIS